MVIFEAPERVVQVVTYDNERGLKFVDVPAYNNFMKTRHVNDLEDDRLTLQVFKEAKTCMIGKPRFHLKPKQEKEVICNFTKEFNSKHMFSSENARHENLRTLPTALITHSELPTKLQPHCPSDYKVQTFKYVNVDEQVVAQTTDGGMIIQDPEIQRDYKNGDFLELDEERLPEGLNNITREKRSARCQRLDDNGRLADATCMRVDISCNAQRGCPAAHVFYSCRENSNGRIIGGSEYILLCSSISNTNCVVHIMSTDVLCMQCCNAGSGCGPGFPECLPRRTLTMKMDIVKFNPNGDYPMVNGQRQTAHITLKYKNKICTTSVLPTDVPSVQTKQTIQLDTQGALGDCWNVDVSSGEDKMVMELKLPASSPIAVSKVKVFDQSDPERCWTSSWKERYGNYNQQNGQWVAGKPASENFSDDCMF